MLPPQRGWDTHPNLGFPHLLAGIGLWFSAIPIEPPHLKERLKNRPL
jgi:hypothetical protein